MKKLFWISLMIGFVILATAIFWLNNHQTATNPSDAWIALSLGGAVAVFLGPPILFWLLKKYGE